MPAVANVEFKNRYRKYFDLALLASLALHLIAFAFMPKIEINPYNTDSEELEVIEIPPEIDIPPPPKAIERPKIPIESLDEDVEEEETIEDTTFNPDDMLDAPPPPPPSSGDFYVFDKAPKPKRMVKPDYPKMARTAEIEGVVVLKVTIDEFGRVIRAVVLQSESSVFDQAAIDAMMQWSFTPAEQSGHPVKATVTIPLRFSLNR
jgi:protein TonB